MDSYCPPQYRLSILSDTNGLSSSTQHKARRSLGNDTDSVHADGDNNKKNVVKAMKFEKKHQFDLIPAIIFIFKEHLVKRNICTACNSTFDNE